MMYRPACLAVCNLRPCCRLLQCPAWQHRPAWLLQQLQPGNRRGCCRWRDHCSAAAPPGLRCTLQHCTGSRLPLFYYRINSDDVQVVPLATSARAAWHHCLLLCVSSKRSNQIIHFKSGQIEKKSGKLCWNIFMSVWHVTRPRHNCQLVLFRAELIELPSCHLLPLPMCNLQNSGRSTRARPTSQNIRKVPGFRIVTPTTHSFPLPLCILILTFISTKNIYWKIWRVSCV